MLGLVRRAALAALPLVVAAILVAGCRPSADDLARTLPTEINGEATRVEAVHNTMSGLVIDDALTALGKSAQDASVAAATAPPDILVVATAVNGVSGPDLLDALQSTWLIAGPVEQATVGGKSVGRSATIAKGQVYFYLHGAIVYVVETADEGLAAAALAALP